MTVNGGVRVPQVDFLISGLRPSPRSRACRNLKTVAHLREMAAHSKGADRVIRKASKRAHEVVMIGTTQSAAGRAPWLFGVMLCVWIASLVSAASAAQTSLWLREPAISPDGSRIAFRFEGQIWIAPIAGGAALPLTPSGFHSASPVWSPSRRNDRLRLRSLRSDEYLRGARARRRGETADLVRRRREARQFHARRQFGSVHVSPIGRRRADFRHPEPFRIGRAAL